jgi:hypothetical protein
MSTVKTDAIETAAGGTSVLTLGTSTQTLKILGGTPGAGKVLTSDADGDATWTTAGAGPGVIQLKTGVKTDTYTSSITGPTDWKSPGLSVVITPTLSTSKIFVMGYCTVAAASTYEQGQRWVRTISGGSAVYLNIADVAGSKTRASSTERINAAKDAKAVPFMFLDAPATTTATTYHLEIVTESSGSDVYLNRTSSETDIAGDFRGASSITVMEIAVGAL